MRAVRKELDRVLITLRHFMRKRAYTQLEVQEALGWGRSYISQLMQQQKALRFDQVLLILKVINVDPGEFWAEVYPPHQIRRLNRQGKIDSVELQPMSTMLNALVKTLTDKELITTEDFEAAVERFR